MLTLFMLKTVAAPADCVAVSGDTAAPPLLIAAMAARAAPVTAQVEDLQVVEVETWEL